MPAADGLRGTRGPRGAREGRRPRCPVGGPRLLDELAVSVDERPAGRARRGRTEGRTVLACRRRRTLLGALALEDEIRPESSEAVGRAARHGLKVAMITGDAQAVADSVARRLGIDEVAAQVLPADKAAAVRRFQDGGRTGRHGWRRRQ